MRPFGPQVHNDDEVRVLFRAVAGEVPGSPIFAMKLAPCSRHLEVGVWVYVWGGEERRSTGSAASQR